MTDPSESRDASAASALDPAHLDGHTIDELSDYLDRGRIPRDPGIESSPGAQNALAALSRLRSLAPRLLESEAEVRDTRDDSWIRRILEQIGVQAHAGRDIPFSDTNAAARLSITEGAVRALIRSAGDEIDGFIVERTSLQGDVGTPGAAITVVVEVSLYASADAQTLLPGFREAVFTALRTHTHMNVETVTVRVRSDDLTEGDDR